MIPGMLHSLGDKPCAKCAEVGHWQEAAPAGELEPVVNCIVELSGLAADSAKRQVKAFVDDPDAEFRVLPSGEAVHDGGPATDGNAAR
jgi:hypothetical protein